MISSCTRIGIWTATGLLALALLAGCSGASSDAVSVVEPDEALALIDDRDDVVIIDVRTPGEYDAGHLVDAELLDFSGGVFAERIGDYERDATYVLYCRTGNRSAQAAALMEELGFTDVRDAGAFDDLAAAGAPTAN